MKMVQPYWRFAIMAMQMMPATSCIQGASVAADCAEDAAAVSDTAGGLPASEATGSGWLPEPMVLSPGRKITRSSAYIPGSAPCDSVSRARVAYSGSTHLSAGPIAIYTGQLGSFPVCATQFPSFGASIRGGNSVADCLRESRGFLDKAISFECCPPHPNAIGNFLLPAHRQQLTPNGVRRSSSQAHK